MIDIHIRICDGRIHDHYMENNVILEEVALAVYTLKQIEQKLIDKQFSSDFEVSEDG